MTRSQEPDPKNKTARKEIGEGKRMEIKKKQWNVSEVRVKGEPNETDHIWHRQLSD